MNKLEEINKHSEYLNDNVDKILDINYSFKRVLNGFRKYQSIQRCDEKFIKNILKIDEHKIITVGEGNYMLYLEEKNGEFSKISKIPTKDKITSILLFKNGNILTSFGKKNHYNIQAWVPNENHLVNKQSNNDLIYNKIINEDLNLDALNEGLASSTLRQNYFQINIVNQFYENSYSFLSSHKDDINVMIEMDDSMFASGSNDKNIIIWKKDQETKKYKIYQKISKEIKNLKSGIKHMIYLYDKRFVSSDSYTSYIWNIEQNILTNPNNYYSIQQKLSNANGNITAMYQIREGSIIICTNSSYFEVFSEREGKYKSVQNINLKINCINCINQLKDDRIIVGSHQGIIKILGLEGNEYKINESITKIQGIPIQCIESFEDGSFLVGQKAILHVWKNNESI